jgi:hypothetical protein
MQFLMISLSTWILYRFSEDETKQFGARQLLFTPALNRLRTLFYSTTDATDQATFRYENDPISGSERTLMELSFIGISPQVAQDNAAAHFPQKNPGSFTG